MFKYYRHTLRHTGLGDADVARRTAEGLDWGARVDTRALSILVLEGELLSPRGAAAIRVRRDAVQPISCVDLLNWIVMVRIGLVVGVWLTRNEWRPVKGMHRPSHATSMPLVPSHWKPEKAVIPALTGAGAKRMQAAMRIDVERVEKCIVERRR